MAKKPEPKTTCWKCGGEGVIYYPPDPDKFPNGGVATCHVCDGAGEL